MNNEIKEITKYNIHCLLFDIFHIGTHHFKSKMLCKLGYHNYLLQKEINCTPIIEQEYDKTGRYITTKLIRYEKNIDIYYQCYCCNKKVGIIE